MTQINAYVGFNGECREAMNFYKDCLGGELTLQTVGESPAAEHCPTAIHGQIMHSSLQNGALLLMGTDMTMPGKFKKGSNISLALNCSSEDELNNFFDSLSAGGIEVEQAPKKEFWGGIFAAFTDKYEIRWMLNYEEPQN